MEYILPHLSTGKRGFKPRVCLVEVVQVIFYRLKTGCQWRKLPVGHFIVRRSCWQHAYYYFNKWSRDGSWQLARVNQSEREANIPVNPRKGMPDTNEYLYYDEELYRRKTVIEHANAWIDSFMALLVRYETSAQNWMPMHWMAFLRIVPQKN